jgi:hypothetical protein
LSLSLISSKAARGFALAVALSVLTAALVAVPVKAGGLAISGTFYRQNFEMPVGSKLSSPDIYVVVFNNGDTDMSIKMTSETPLDVKLIFSENNFELRAGGQNKVEISIEVGQQAIPGEYELKVTAEAYKEAEGIQLLGAAGQDAKLTIIGEAASVEITVVSPSGEPVPAVIRLYKQVDSDTFDVGYSETGSLKAEVAPGNYVASAYVVDKKAAEESFNISAEEEKKILLEVKTVYFEGFGIVPHYQKDTGELAMAKIVYAVNNLYQAFPQAEVILKVSHDGASLDETTLVSLAPLEKGKIELSYNYIPSEGWQQGVYHFKLELRINGETYTTSPEKELEGSSSTLPTTAGVTFNWTLVGGIAGGMVLVVVVIIMLVRRRVF